MYIHPLPGQCVHSQYVMYAISFGCNSSSVLSNLIVCNPGFDLILQDTVFWPGALLGELLDIPIVEVLPLPIMTHKEYEMSFPNPLAYAPQMGLGYTVQMVLTNLQICC